MFASSRAASTSSRMQNGLGRRLKIASNSRRASQRLFAAGEQRNAAEFLAWRTGDDLDASFEHVNVFFEHNVGGAAAEETPE